MMRYSNQECWGLNSTDSCLIVWLRQCKIFRKLPLFTGISKIISWQSLDVRHLFHGCLIWIWLFSDLPCNFGIWLLACGSWCLALGVWLLVSGSWRLTLGVWLLASALGIWLLVSGSWRLTHDHWWFFFRISVPFLLFTILVW